MVAFVQTPGGGIDVTRGNSRQLVYLKGRADEDGSIRFSVVDGDEFAHLELNTEGIWRDTGIRLDSVKFGKLIKVDAFGDFLQTANIPMGSGTAQAVIPQVPFNAAGSTFGQSVVIDKLKTTVISGPTDGEISGTLLGATIPGSQLTVNNSLRQIIHKVGSIGATENIFYSIYAGLNNAGSLLFSTEIVADEFSAGASPVIALGNEILFYAGQDIFIEFSSTATFSLSVESGGGPLITINAQEFKRVDVVTAGFLLGADAQMLFDNEGNLLYKDFF